MFLTSHDYLILNFFQPAIANLGDPAPTFVISSLVNALARLWLTDVAAANVDPDITDSPIANHANVMVTPSLAILSQESVSIAWLVINHTS